MNLLRNFRRVIAVLIWLALAIALLRTAAAAPHEGREEKFKVLQTRTRSYTNVTVTTRADSYIFILHSGGMENVQLDELPPEVLQKLGYAIDSKRIHSAPAPAQTTARVRPAGTASPAQSAAGPSRGQPAWVRSIGTVLLVILGICLVVYLFYCYCLSLICKKAGSEPGLMIWLPLLQYIPMVRAAGMAPHWLIGFYAPLVFGIVLPMARGSHTPGLALLMIGLPVICSVFNLVAWIFWCINIVRAREKSPWVALFLILPFTSLFAFFYLAFSSSASDAEPAKYKSMALQTA
jgi:hypothetical protein